jgi:hypothetical protein
MVQTAKSSYINGANLMHIGFVQAGAAGRRPGVPLQLHRRLHLHVVLEEATAERGMVVGLPRRGLDGLGGSSSPAAPSQAALGFQARRALAACRASALYMWYACRYELRAPMMGPNGSLIRSPKCSLSQG